MSERTTYRDPELAVFELKGPKEIEVWFKRLKQPMADAAVYDLIRDSQSFKWRKSITETWFAWRNLAVSSRPRKPTAEQFMVPVQLAGNLRLKPGQLEKVGRRCGEGGIVCGGALRGHKHQSTCLQTELPSLKSPESGSSDSGGGGEL